MATYDKKAQEKVEETMHEFKRGSGRQVTKRKQAIAIGLHEAREEGAKVPPPKKPGKKAA